MLIVAALNLPNTIEFEAQTEDVKSEDEEPISITETEAKTFLDELDKSNSRPSLEVPFNFAHESRALQPPNKANTAVPNKGIVDDRISAPKNLPAIVNMSVKTKKTVLPESSLQRQSQQPSPLDFPSVVTDSPLQKAWNSPFYNLRARRRAGSMRRHSSVDFAQVPWKVVRQKKGNGGLYNAIFRAKKENDMDVSWVGLLGMPTDELPPSMKRNVSKSLRSFNCHVAYVTDCAIEGHYDNYCKELIWPILHCQVPVIPLSKKYEDHTWQDYVEVNEVIARKIVQIYKPGDTIWVHDYHLMLVPQMVREQLPNAAIGFFMHVAFPSSEVFRCLANRAELLQGVLASNLVGFQISEYVQHFMMTAARILAVDTSEGRVEVDGRDVEIMACAIGADPEKLDEVMEKEEVGSFRKTIRNRWPTSKLIVARDKLGPTRGLRQKLQAYRLFLTEHPQWANKAVLIQVALSDTDDDDSTDIEAIADSINSEFGDLAAGVQPVVLLRKNIVFEQYLALIAEADAFIVSALRDGMNLTCHEFVYCNNAGRNAPLILSEFTGSASLFHDDALLVNPYDQKEMSSAFYEALSMGAEERMKRSTALRNYISEHTGARWVNNSLLALKEAWMVEQARTVQKPDISTLKTHYASSGSRLLIVEIGVGASPLAPTSAYAATRGAAPPRPPPVGRPALPHSMSSYYSSRLTFVLRGLLSDEKNVIYVSSAESCAHMDRVFRTLPGVGLIAESGKYIRYFGDEEWYEIGLPSNNDWQHDVAKVIKPMQEMELLKKVDFHESTIVLHMDQTLTNSDERHRTSLGVYVSLINETFSYRGVRCRIEDDKMIIYTEDIGIQRLQACLNVLTTVAEPIGFMMYANQPISLDADDVIYRLLERRKQNGSIESLVTILLGKHPTVANCTMDGINSLLTMLEIISSK